MGEVWIERRKWPDAPHYGHAGWILGEDEHGLWLELRIGSPVYRGEELLFHGTSGGLMLVPPTDGWLAWFPEFGDFELYVDVVSGTSRTESAVTMVDLDLDVIRRRDGTVELLDVDEFEAHQAELGYPEHLISHAERVAGSSRRCSSGGRALRRRSRAALDEPTTKLTPARTPISDAERPSACPSSRWRPPLNR